MQATLKEVRSEREEEYPELPPARYPKSKAVLRAMEDVEKWFTTEVLSKHKLLYTSEKWSAQIPSPPQPPDMDQLYLTEVQVPSNSRAVLPSSQSPTLPPKLQVQFTTPNDSFEDVQPEKQADSESSFEDIA